MKGSWPDRRFEALLGSRLPIIAAPMAGAGGVDLAVAAMEGGAVGSLPAAMLDPPTLRGQAAAVRARSGGPINLNFFCHEMPEQTDDRAWRDLLRPFYFAYGLDPAVGGGALRRPFDAAMCEAVEDIRPDIVSFHFGLPDAALQERVRRTGARILGNATSVDEARHLDAHGVDGVIAQGWEAGGHAGRFLGARHEQHMGLFALVPQVADVISVPVIAAGGIADGRGIAAAFLLGASAVQVGTAYLASPESQVDAEHRRRLASPDAERTEFTNLYSGGLARGLTTRLTEALGPIRPEAPPFPLASRALGPLAAEAAARGESGFRPMWAGQAARLASPLPARALTETLGRDALALLGREA
jgi:nitronate monooxygenase